MKDLRFSWLFLALLIASRSFGSFLSEHPEIRHNRILIGGGIRSTGIGLSYQRSLAGIWGGEGSIGFFPLEGIHGSLGGSAMWRQDRRFRPRVHFGLSWVSGMSPMTARLSVDGRSAETRFEAFSGFHAIVTGGFQFRLWKGLGLGYDLGFRQTLSGGGHRILSSTDEDVSRRALDAMTGNGTSFSARGFWEF